MLPRLHRARGSAASRRLRASRSGAVSLKPCVQAEACKSVRGAKSRGKRQSMIFLWPAALPACVRRT
jgi:hypothetical protein